MLSLVEEDPVHTDGMKRRLQEAFGLNITSDPKSVKHALNKFKAYLNLSDLTISDRELFELEQFAVSVRLPCVVNSLQDRQRGALVIPDANSSTTSMEIENANAPASVLRGILTALKQSRIQGDLERMTFYDKKEEPQRNPIVDRSLLFEVANLVSRAYFIPTSNRKAAARTKLEIALAENKLVLPSSVGEIHVTITNERGMHKGWGLFDTKNGPYSMADERGQLQEGDDQIPTVEYDVSTFIYSVITSSLYEGGSGTLKTRTFPRISSDSLNTLVENANQRFSFCTPFEWKRIIQQLYLTSQSDRVVFIRNEDKDVEKDIGSKVQRVTNKDYASISLASYLSLSSLWSIVVTVSHNSRGGGVLPKVFVSDTLEAGRGTKWNDQIYPYKEGSKTTVSELSSNWNQKMMYDFVMKKSHRFGVEYFSDPVKALNDVGNSKPKADASMVMEFTYDKDDQIPMLNHMQITSSEQNEVCVSVKVDENHRSMYIGSLFYNLDNDTREGCRVYVGDNDRKTGAGSIVLKTIASMASSLGFNYLTLIDASAFVDISTMPYWGPIQMTSYLRLIRGYGFYEGIGFFARPSAESSKQQQKVLDYHHWFFTTTITELIDSTEELESFETRVRALEDADISADENDIRLIMRSIKQCLESLKRSGRFQSIKDKSMRTIVKEANDLVEPYRPKDASQYSDWKKMQDDWKRAVKEGLVGNNYNNEYEYLAGVDVAETIVYSLHGMTDIRTTTSYAKKLFDQMDLYGQIKPLHYICVPGVNGGSPTVVEKPLNFGFNVTPA